MALIEETGTVVSIHGDMANVETQRRSACGRCSAADGTCGTSLIARYFGNRRLLLKAYNAIGAEPGDRVVIGLPDGTLLEAAFFAYLVPLLGMIGGAMAGAGIAGMVSPAYEQPISILGGFGGLAAALTWLPRLAKSKRSGKDKRPQIVRRAVLTGNVQTARLQTPHVPGRNEIGGRDGEVAKKS